MDVTFLRVRYRPVRFRGSSLANQCAGCYILVEKKNECHSAVHFCVHVACPIVLLRKRSVSNRTEFQI